MLKEVLALFGEGIRESLQRTMGDFLEATKGAKAESQLEDWERQKYGKALATNNAAERPFAVIKELLHSFPSMRLCFLSATSHSRVNGTFRVAEAGGKFQKTKHRVGVKAGAAMTSDPFLIQTIHTMTSIRDRNPGDLTKLWRQWELEDHLACSAHRQTRDANNLKEQMRLMEGRAERANTAHEVPLLVTVAELRRELLSCEGVKHRCVKMLKDQIDGRIKGRGFKYPTSAIGHNFRTRHGVLKKGPPEGKDEIAYLQELTEKMVAHDLEVGQISAAPVVRLARSLHLMCAKYTLAQSTTLKKELQEKMAKAATPVDDEMLVQLAAKYTGRLFYDYERDKITYRIEDIKCVANKRNMNPPCWEAECIPVELTAEGWSVPSKYLVHDSTGASAIKKKARVGFGLVELIGEAESPSPMPWVDLYISRHEDIVAKGLYRPAKE